MDIVLQDTVWNDIDYMVNHLDWTYDASGQYKNLPDLVSDIHNHSQKYVLIVVGSLYKHSFP